MQSNKGRFKCPHEAQAVWNLYVLEHGKNYAVRSISSCTINISEFATHLHQARLIHGTIYDEDGRIENKDVAHEICLSYQEHFWWFKNLDGHILDIVRDKKIRGTIFY